MAIWKAHHGTMKFIAQRDYDAVVKHCVANGLPVIAPTGKHWHRIEDATAAMLKNIPEDVDCGIVKDRRFYYTTI